MKYNEKTDKIIVAGAGPAGMMAAIRAGQRGQGVILIEKNPNPGRKLLLSGKGRCNITNACGLDSFLDRFSKNRHFLRDAFKSFFNRELVAFFQERGLRLKTERQMRVFPVTDRADSILEVLKKELYKNKVKILYGAELKDVITEGNEIKGIILKDKRRLYCARLILATGGVSYGFTGSTGEGLDIAKRMGHSIVKPCPGLIGLDIRQAYPKLLEGLTLKNIRLHFTDGKKHIISDIGELLFTESGISGPLALSLSGRVIGWLGEGKKVSVEIDLKPALSKEQVEKRLLRDFESNSKKSIRNILKDILPQRLIALFMDIAGINPGKKGNQITHAERNQLALLLKGLHLDISGSRPFSEAMITRGGVSLKDIDPRTMQSRIIRGLYFCGEMIDVDADTGGFNLQAAFSTGYLAGESASLAWLDNALIFT